jgi:2-methylcitrate dehydratase PrpD
LEWTDRSVHAAAIINGTAAHSLDFDDRHDQAVLHAGVSVIPAALAVAEAGGASGQAPLDAVALGYDVQARVALVPSKRLGTPAGITRLPAGSSGRPPPPAV